MKLFSEETLAHYGIPGQKKGVRRWQYEDGRFNEEGKERYFGKSEREIRKIEKHNAKGTAPILRKLGSSIGVAYMQANYGRDKDNINDQINKLKSMYKDGKIDKSTYNRLYNNLSDKQKSLEKTYKEKMIERFGKTGYNSIDNMVKEESKKLKEIYDKQKMRSIDYEIEKDNAPKEPDRPKEVILKIDSGNKKTKSFFDDWGDDDWDDDDLDDDDWDDDDWDDDDN